MGSGKLLKRAIEKHGIDNFKKEILFCFDDEKEMNDKEKELVTEEFLKRDDVYNLCPGGHGGFGYLNDGSDEHIERTKKAGRLGGIALTGRKKSRDQIENHSRILKFKYSNGSLTPNRAFKGKFHTKEWKQNHSNIMKEKQSGSKNSQYGTMWITNGIENKKIKKDIDIIPEGWYKGRITRRANRL